MNSGKEYTTIFMAGTGRRNTKRSAQQGESNGNDSSSDSSGDQSRNGSSGRSAGRTNSSSGTEANEAAATERSNIPTPMASTHSGSSAVESELSVAGWQPIVSVTDFRSTQTANRIKR